MYKHKWMAYINETRHFSSAPSDLHSVKNTSAAHTCTTFGRCYIFVWQTLGFLVTVILLTQRTQHLITFYLSVAALGVIVWSYVLNVEYVKYCSELLFEHSSLQHELFVLNGKAFTNFLFAVICLSHFCQLYFVFLL
ncbi:hypothetical protein CEXT_697871 [Caerostris extrusa]|uniref:TRC8-like N-terminal domain-containing protein n=1 Tax=Caerostris extrusa TaxID=172846 RepID=A0AAV4PYY5_CAEEX|nr:hypothetical protein CEXT_697871 [Caerostris extrusa]